MNARCCGIAGTYGLKVEKYEIAHGGRRATCSTRSPRPAPRRCVCDSETCRWQIADATKRPAVHPIEYLYRAYGLDS